MTNEERITILETNIGKITKLIEEFTTISLEHTKHLNNLLDIGILHKGRITCLEKRLQDFEADIKVIYSKVKDMEKLK